MAFDGMEHVEFESVDLVLTPAAVTDIRQVLPKVYQQVGNKRVEISATMNSWMIAVPRSPWQPMIAAIRWSLIRHKSCIDF
jgi:hypothetical protein